MGEPQKYIWLNGVRIPIRGTVTWKRITPFPSQFMTGSPGENDYTPTRKQKWGNMKGGLGKDKWAPGDNDRYSDATTVDASRELTTLGPLVTTLGTFGVEPVKIIKFQNRVWAVGHNKISYWSGSAWTPVKTDFPSPTDAVVFYGSTA
uniref:Uncharacterized protein n=1 Tax=viral metagenome TaxID=1070528 RepID=A0A6M3KAB8_9ZZZZ